MPKEKLLKDQISYTEERPLQSEEIQLLKDKVFRQVIIYLPIYILFLGGALILYYNAPMAFKMIVDPSELDDEEITRMLKLGPYIGLFVFLLATIFFGKIFYQSILPLFINIFFTVISDINKLRRELHNRIQYLPDAFNTLPF